MEDDIDMGDNKIVNLKNPVINTDAANMEYVNNVSINLNNKIKKYVDDKIEESEEKSIQAVNQENVFKKVMDDDEFKEDDDDIHKMGVQNKDFHLVNKKTYEFNIDYDSSLGYYSTRLSIDLIYLPTGSYTMVYEMYIDDGLTVDQIDASSGTLTVGKINSKIDGTNTRSIIHFTKYSLSSGFDDLDIDIKLKGKTDPQTTIYVVVYGVKGQVNNVPVNLWDRFYCYDNTSLKYELPINMNNKKITGVVDGNDDSDVVTMKQFNQHPNPKWYYFTNDLRHNNNSVLGFGSMDKYPFSVDIHSFYIKIVESGFYQIIYQDYYKNGGTVVIYDETNNKDLFRSVLVNKSSFSYYSLNAVVKINLEDDQDHNEISIFIETTNGGIFYGKGYSTFMIKYLHEI